MRHIHLLAATGALAILFSIALAAETRPAVPATAPSTGEALPRPDPGLLEAIRAKDLEHVRRVLDRGAKVNTVGYTPLSLAVTCRQEEIVLLLLHRGANPNSRDNCGATAIALAAYLGDTNVAKLLLDAGANVDLEMALECAAGQGNADCVRLLVKSKANLDARGFSGRTALHEAAMRGHADVVQILLHAGADTTIADDNGRTAAALAKGRGYPVTANMIELHNTTATRPSPANNR
jgi:ankyrin repeat protein